LCSVPVLPERSFSPGLDLCDSLHGLQRRLHQISRILDRDVSTLFELESLVLHDHKMQLSAPKIQPAGTEKTTYDSHLLACRLSESFCPSNLSWVSLHLEVLVTSDEEGLSVSYKLSNDECSASR
jgi:hypothetical protein